jgi:hypothetical protein
LICSECGAENSPENNFCDECGGDLSAPPKPLPKDLSPDDKLAKIQRYLPQGLAEKILSQRDKIEGERKQITVMFCDLEGFTPLSEKLDPEEAYTLVDPIYEILIHGTREYGGTVNEMTGDGIIALFGAPVALEDAPQRAIRAALAIHREMARFNEKMKQERSDLPTLRMRIGIHTGPIVVGTLGNDLRVEFKAVGDTVNLGGWPSRERPTSAARPSSSPRAYSGSRGWGRKKSTARQSWSKPTASSPRAAAGQSSTSPPNEA